MGSFETKIFDVAAEKSSAKGKSSARLLGVRIEPVADIPDIYVYDTDSNQLVIPHFGEGYVKSDSRLQIAEITAADI